jgi:hypothetical protein
MGKLFKAYLSGPGVYKCHGCDTHLAKHSDIISKVPLPSPPPPNLQVIQEIPHPSIQLFVVNAQHLTCDPMLVQAFQSRSGKAYLFDKAVNVTSGPKEVRPATRE